MHQERKASPMMLLIAVAAAVLVLAVFGKSVRAAGLLKEKNGRPSAIAIQDHRVAVTIDNGFACTEVDQVFVNGGQTDLEGIYSFPLPKSASLAEVSLFIDGREIVGEVLEKVRAREVYEEQKSKGNDTALAEKDDYKTFNIAVSPVRAGAETRVRLVYYQPLTIDLNIGRYVYPLAEGGVDDERLAFWAVDDAVSGQFVFDLTLKSAVPVKDVRLPGYMGQAKIETDAAGGVSKVHLEFSEGARLAEDIVFYYRLDDSVPARVELVPFKEPGAADGTFMLTITPGASLARISEGTDWVFVLDTSGSMSGDKIRTLADGVGKVIGKMSGADRFRIVTFSNETSDLTRGYIDGTPENIQAVLAQVQQLQAGGGTNLYAGLSAGLKKTDDERTTAIVLVTDGVANIGPTGHADFLRLVRDRDIRLFTFVIGNSANRPLLADLARESGGFAMDISPRDDIYGRIVQAKSKVLFQNMHDVEVRFDGGGIKDVQPAAIGSLYQGQQAVVFGRYTRAEPVEVTMRARISGEEREYRCRVILPESDTDNPEIERLWALAAIDEIAAKIRDEGETEERRGQVVALGTEYSLVTDYTSMVVMKDEEFEGQGIERRNQARVARERQAEAQRAAAPVKDYRADGAPDNAMFRGASSPGVGSGPVSPLLLLVIGGCALLMRRKDRGNR